MKKVKFEDLLVGAVLPGLLVLFVLMAVGFSVPEAIPYIAMAAAAGMLSAFLLQQDWLRPALRKGFSVALCVALIGGVVALAIDPQSINNISKNSFSYAPYFDISAVVQPKAEVVRSKSDGKPASNGSVSSEDNYGSTGSKVTLNGNKITVNAHSKYESSICDPDGYYDVYTDKVTVTVKNIQPAALSVSVTYSGVDGKSGSTTINLAKSGASGDSFTFTVSSTVGVNVPDVVGTVTINSVVDTVSNPPVPVTTTFLPKTGGTISVDAAVVTASTVKTAQGDQSHTLVAQPDTENGYTFYGWMSDKTGLLSTSAQYTLELMEGLNQNVWPVFVREDEALFYTKQGYYTHYYKYLDEALAAFPQSATIVQCKSGTLYHSTGGNTFNINGNQNLLIPYSESDTGMFKAIPDSVATVGEDVATYMTLTVPDGTTINCSGAINVNGQRNNDKQGAEGTGIPRGNHGLMILDGANATLNITGKLFCYGFISGSGTVNLANGAEFRELMQVYDWPGGTNALGSTGTGGWKGSADKNTLLMISQYTFQSVEAKLVAAYGSSMYGEAVLSAGGAQATSSTKILGTSGSLFVLEAGTSMNRTYDPATDQVTYYFTSTGESNASVGNLTVSAVALGIIPVSISSSDYVMPVNNAMTVRIGSGVTMKIDQASAFMPGSELIIDKGGTLEVNNSLYILEENAIPSELVFNTNHAGLSTKWIAPKYTVGRGTNVRIIGAESAKLEVNGTLSIGTNGGVYTGAVYSDGVAADPDRVIQGTGTIEYAAGMTSQNEVVLKNGYNENIKALKVEDGHLHLAGTDTISKVSNITPNTYHGIILEQDAQGNYHMVTDTSDNPDLPNINCWYTDMDSSNVATCTTDGAIKLHTGNAETAISVKQPALGHDWGEPAYGWNADKTEFIATVTCKRDNCGATDTDIAVLTEITEKRENPTCTKPGKASYNAVFAKTWAENQSVEKDLPIDPAAHVWGDWSTGKCADCDAKAIQYDAFSLSIDAEIKLIMKFYIHNDLIQASGAQVTVTEEGNAVIGQTHSTTTDLIRLTPENSQTKGIRYAVSEGIAAGEMPGDVTVAFTVPVNGQTVTVPIYDADDITAPGVETLTKTVQNFAETVLAANDERHINLCKAALTFGGYAQVFYGTHTETPAYELDGYGAMEWTESDVKEALKAYSDRTAFSGALDIKATTQKLNLDSSIYIRTYFTLPDGMTLEQAKAAYAITITRPTQNGAYLVNEQGNWGMEGSRFYVDILNVPPAYWDNTYTITISDGAEEYKVTTNVLAWCYRCIHAPTSSPKHEQQKAMANTMYLYCGAANTFFSQEIGTDPTEYLPQTPNT